VGEPYFIKLTMPNGTDTWVNLGNVAFVYQQSGAQTTIRFAGSGEHQISVKESLRDVAEHLPPY
jgi:hypothetical protein